MNKTEVLRRLDIRTFYTDAIPSLRINGKAEATGLCPFHDDHTPSLSANIETGLWICRAGCGQGSVFDFVMRRDGVTFPEAVQSLGERAGMDGKNESRRILRRFRWTDAEGREAWHLRWDGDPKFTWAKDQDGKTPGRGDCKPTLYGLEAIALASEIILVEGERDADTLNALLTTPGIRTLLATCTANGAADVKAHYLSALEGKATVYLSGDNDAAGRKYLDRCGALVDGKVLDLRVLPVPAGSKDWTDWQEQGGTAETLRALLTGAAPWTPRTPPAASLPARADDEPHLTDLGNAQRFVARHHLDVRHSDLCDWLAWDRTQWAANAHKAVTGMGKETVMALHHEASLLPDQDRKALLAHALRSESEPRLRAMLKLAESDPRLAITPDRFDRDPWLLNCTNGTIDLRTGVLGPHRREDFITKLIPLAYDPTAPCPRWEHFLHHIFAGDAALLAFVQRAVGYSLTGLTIEQVLMVLFGPGANGKSTFTTLLRAMLAEYAVAIQAETLLVKHGDPVRTDLARLAGARFVSAVEPDAGRRLDEALVKSITGGDPLTARFLYREEFTFAPTFKVWLACNHRPTIRGTDRAIWRRIRLLPFGVTIPEEEQDKTLVEKLTAELAGILAWAVRGCRDWQEQGLDAPPVVTDATAAYRAEQDVLGHFLREQCVLEPSARETAKDLYASYTTWCDQSGEKTIITKTAFGLALTERGCVAGRTMTGRCWTGIRLRLATDSDDLTAEAPASAGLSPAPEEVNVDVD